MKRWNYWGEALLILAVIFALTGALVLGSVVAAAQEGTETATPTQTPTTTPIPTDRPVDQVVDEATGEDDETPTDEPEQSDETPTVIEDFGTVRIVDEHWTEDSVIVTFEADTIRRISAQDYSSVFAAAESQLTGDRGTVELTGTTKRYNLKEGTNKIEIPITRYNGLGVYAVTINGRSIARYDVIDNSWLPANFSTGETRLVGAVGVTIGATLVVLLIRRSRKKLARAVKKL
ncbi:hypothetical protein I7X12_07810 [Halosimplex litoreum]|uniref:Uncharacterized protein n=1 Tax=Halosimplex litoreum TaxID=1198301 RepID=A0A7T3G173_9EURY|nr:hypothetical protein [Halosimplex litoreum]QPV64506.1 hypothetical protein I7X12_07810 [Halosimplex litoreum]